MPRRKRKRETRPVTPPADDPDLISSLPDAVIASVLSRLPVKESIRTSILSSRWRHLWTITPLTFDDFSLLEPYHDEENNLVRTREIVSHILTSHTGPIRRCGLSSFSSSEFYQTADAHIQTLTQRGIEELDLYFNFNNNNPNGEPPYKLPISIASCKSLSKLSLEEGCFLDPPFPSSSFQNLKYLQLKSVLLSNETITCLLQTAACLEILGLLDCFGVDLVRVSSMRLRKLSLKFSNFETGRIVIENAPNLRNLMLGETTTTNCQSFVILHAPKLQRLGVVDLKARFLQLGNSSFRWQDDSMLISSQHLPILIDIRSVLSSVKTLTIRVMFFDERMRELLPSFLRCFPRLLSLEIMLVGIYPRMDDIDWEKNGPLDFVKCLKTVTIKSFGKFHWDIEFARFLVLNGQVLKRMTLLCSDSVTTKWKEMMRRRLHLRNRASIDLELKFLEDSHLWVPALL